MRFVGLDEIVMITKHFRQHKRLFSGGIALIALLVVAGGSLASGWCRADPIVRLGDTEYQILVAVPNENQHQVDGELLFEIYSPEDSEQELLFIDAGFNGYGEKVVFKRHEAEDYHMVYLDVPKNGDDFPVIVEVFVDGELIIEQLGDSDVMWVQIPIEDD